jgi:hypothetical protein
MDYEELRSYDRDNFTVDRGETMRLEMPILQREEGS